MIRMMAGVIGVPVAGAAAFVTMSPSGEVHEMDRFTAYRTLKAMSFQDIGPELRDANGSVRVTGVPGEEVVWTVSALGGKIATVRAELEGTDATHTRVTMSHHAYDHPDATLNTDLIRAVVRYGLEEKIDATLDGRPFDVAQLQQRVVSYAVTNPGSVVAVRRSVTDESFHPSREEMIREPMPSGPSDPAIAVEARERAEAKRMREASAPSLRP